MHQALERAAHGFGVAEAAFFGDEFDRLGRFFEPAPRGFDADLRHETRGCHADLLGEDTRETAVAINQPIRFGRDQFNLVGSLLRVEIVLTELVCFGEDRQRPGNVQDLGARKGDDADPARVGFSRAFV
jgi:hypothetical protein